VGIFSRDTLMLQSTISIYIQAVDVRKSSARMRLINVVKRMFKRRLSATEPGFSINKPATRALLGRLCPFFSKGRVIAPPGLLVLLATRNN